MNWLLDRPLFIVLWGVVICIPIAIGWVASGRKEVLYGLIAALVLVAGLLITERLVTSDREALEITLQQIARDVESNDPQAVLGHVYSGAPALKAKAQQELPNYQFTQCRITRVHEIVVNSQDQPKSAVIQFNVAAAGSFKAEGMELTASKEQPIMRYVELKMRQEADGRWTVEDYSHAEPQAFMFDPNQKHTP